MSTDQHTRGALIAIALYAAIAFGVISLSCEALR
jgi:hypothetical protein